MKLYCIDADGQPYEDHGGLPARPESNRVFISAEKRDAYLRDQKLRVPNLPHEVADVGRQDNTAVAAAVVDVGVVAVDEKPAAAKSVRSRSRRKVSDAGA